MDNLIFIDTEGTLLILIYKNLSFPFFRTDIHSLCSQRYISQRYKVQLARHFFLLFLQAVTDTKCSQRDTFSAFFASAVTETTGSYRYKMQLARHFFLFFCKCSYRYTFFVIFCKCSQRYKVQLAIHSYEFQPSLTAILKICIRQKNHLKGNCKLYRMVFLYNCFV